MLLTALLVFFNLPIHSQPIKVEIIAEENGSFTLLRGGEPYFIKGGGSSNKDRFEELEKRGGNSVRTWGVDATTGSMLRKAEEHGLTVMLGLWMKKERDGFDYDDEEKVQEQLESFRNYVRSFRNYPALIAWSIGNEIEVGAANLNMWNAVNDISKMIHEEDTNHLTLTITASISTSKANAIAERAPDLDMLGINNYGGITGMHSRIADSNWDKPYILTEWGVNGPWEVGKTSWEAPRELNSSQKAELFQSRYQEYILPYSDLMPGSYAFYWHSKFEATHTWFGLFVGSETTEMIDRLQYVWTGDWSENTAPQIGSLKINSKTQENNLKITSMTGNIVEFDVTDPEGDDLFFEFLIMPESGDALVEPIEGATYHAIPGISGFSDSGTFQADFENIHNNRNLRLYALAHDGHGHVGTATFPFQTDFVPEDTTSSQLPIFADLIIYPNPSKGIIYLQTGAADGYIMIRLFNTSGVLLEEYTNCDLSAPFAIDLSRYDAMVYFLELTDVSGSRKVYKLLTHQ